MALGVGLIVGLIIEPASGADGVSGWSEGGFVVVSLSLDGFDVSCSELAISVDMVTGN